MVTEIVIAEQNFQPGYAVVWSKIRSFGAGNVKVNITDITISPSTGWPRYDYLFDYVDYEVGIFRRSGESSAIIGKKTIRRYWGQGENWVTIKAVPAGRYSLKTTPKAAFYNGENILLKGGKWGKATFELYHH